MEQTIGRVKQIVGPIVDVQFHPQHINKEDFNV